MSFRSTDIPTAHAREAVNWRHNTHDDLATKAPGTPEGNLAMFDATGNITDSGKKYADVTTADHSQRTLPIGDGNILTGEVNWIIVKLNDNISLISFYGWLEVITAHASDFVILSVTDEPLFGRFLGRVDKIAWEEDDTTGISGLHYHFDNTGITFDSVTDSQVLNKRMNFHEVLFFVTT